MLIVRHMPQQSSLRLRVRYVSNEKHANTGSVMSQEIKAVPIAQNSCISISREQCLKKLLTASLACGTLSYY